MSASPITEPARGTLLERHPLAAFAAIVIPITWATQLGFLAADVDITPALLLELVVLVATAGLIARRTRRDGLREMFAGTFRWRLPARRWALLIGAMPVLTLSVAAITGTSTAPDEGWLAMIGGYLFMALVFGALIGNLWEEAAWTGFAQRRLIEDHGLLRGSLRAAIPFSVIHLPLVFAEDGLRGTSLGDVLVGWTLLIVAAPFFRYLAGAVLLDTSNSLLAVAVMHGSFNAAGALSAAGDWQHIPAMILLSVTVGLWRTRAQSVSATELGTIQTRHGRQRPHTELAA